MVDVRDLYRRGDAVYVKTPFMSEWRTGRVVGFGNHLKNPSCVRIILDGGRTPYTISCKFVEKLRESNDHAEV
jgi:hypothetical protein